MLSKCLRPCGRVLALWPTLLLVAWGAQASEDRAPAPADVVSESEGYTLTVEDYREYLSGPGDEDFLGLTKSRDALREMALDFHSQVVLARQAEEAGLHEDPKIAARIARERRAILVKALMRKQIEERGMPDLEPLARERYIKDREQFREPDRRKVAHILLRDKQDCPCDDTAPAAERAADLRQALLSGETDFATAAAEHSQDPGTAEKGGALGVWLKQDGSTAAAFEEAVFALEEEGAISEPVTTRFGVHLIKLLEREPSRIPDFEEVKPRIIKKLKEEVRKSVLVDARSMAYPNPETIDVDALAALAAEMREQRRADGADAAADGAKAE